MPHILIIEDDPAIVVGLRDSLESEKYTVSAETDGARGLKHAMDKGIDCIILDVLLPTLDGREICKRLRANSVRTPIIMLTSKTEEVDKVMGLELGADDYVTKPFSIRELTARVKAQLRRASPHAIPGIVEAKFGNVYLNFQKQEARVGKKELKLSSRELEVMKYLIEHEGIVVTREMLLDDVWGYDNFPTTRTVDNYILMLRKKLEEDQSSPHHILTVHTQGYKFVR